MSSFANAAVAVEVLVAGSGTFDFQNLSQTLDGLVSGNLNSGGVSESIQVNQFNENLGTLISAKLMFTAETSSVSASIDENNPAFFGETITARTRIGANFISELLPFDETIDVRADGLADVSVSCQFGAGGACVNSASASGPPTTIMKFVEMEFLPLMVGDSSIEFFIRPRFISGRTVDDLDILAATSTSHTANIAGTFSVVYEFEAGQTEVPLPPSLLLLGVPLLGLFKRFS